MAAACLASPSRPELYALGDMRTPGLAEKCREVFVGSLTDRSLRGDVVRGVQPDLVLVGPEEPLVDGFVDDMESMGIPAFGPTAQLARIESSKSWARGILDRHGIEGNPEYRVFESQAGLRRCMEDLGAFVVKPDGLTAGKGVRVFGEHLTSIEDAMAYATALIAQDGRVQVEERLEGEEFSLQTITDGESAIHCPLVQDHKRAFEGDEGPNTGGMGSYSCPDLSLPFLRDSDVAAAHSISERVVEALAREVGRPYRGVLYGGFMATAGGVRLIECNARFGDPEAMNVLPILRADFVELCLDVAAGRLRPPSQPFDPKATVCKYVVPAAYPDSIGEPGEIAVPDEYGAEGDARWYWAACRQGEDGSGAYMTSSRSGASVGMGDSLEEAERVAEQVAGAVGGNVRHRADIGRPEAIEARVRHMEALRTGSGTGTLSARAA